MKVVVTGAGGFFGLNLVDAFLAQRRVVSRLHAVDGGFATRHSPLAPLVPMHLRLPWRPLPGQMLVITTRQ